MVKHSGSSLTVEEDACNMADGVRDRCGLRSSEKITGFVIGRFGRCHQRLANPSGSALHNTFYFRIPETLAYLRSGLEGRLWWYLNPKMKLVCPFLASFIFCEDPSRSGFEFHRIAPGKMHLVNRIEKGSLKLGVYYVRWKCELSYEIERNRLCGALPVATTPAGTMQTRSNETSLSRR
jgi:hypothetical protein